jgi:hypothetical protein
VRLGPYGLRSGLKMLCPAAMCPLIAKDGSPWTGQKASPCPGRGLEDENDYGGCPWWDMACSCGGIQAQVEEAALNEGRAMIAGPNRQRRQISNSRSFDCPMAGQCRWQEQAEKAGRPLCPPRDALERGIDPRVCLF